MARTRKTERTMQSQTSDTPASSSSRKRRIEETNEDASVPLHRVEERPAKRKRTLPPEDYIDLTLDDDVDAKLQPSTSAPSTSTPTTTTTATVEECSICYENIKDQGKLDSCVHLFCFECIFKWSKQANVCPICKQRFNAIEKVDQATGLPCQLNETERQASAPAPTHPHRRRGPATRTRTPAANVVNVQQRDFHLTPQDGDFYFPQGAELFANAFRGLLDRIATFYGGALTVATNRPPVVTPVAPPSNPDAPIVIDDDDNNGSQSDDNSDSDASNNDPFDIFGDHDANAVLADLFDDDEEDFEPYFLAPPADHMRQHMETHQRHVQQALQIHNAHPLMQRHQQQQQTTTTRIVRIQPHPLQQRFQPAQQQTMTTRIVHVPPQQPQPQQRRAAYQTRQQSRRS